MSHRLRTDSQPSMELEFLQVGQSEFLAGVKDTGPPADGRAHVDELVDVKAYAGVAHHRALDVTGTDSANRESVCPRTLKHIVCCFYATAAGHVLHHDGRISGD